MKNSTTSLLVAVTLAFSAFVGGYCLGRNTAGVNVELSAYTTTTSSAVADALSSSALSTTADSPAPTIESTSPPESASPSESTSPSEITSPTESTSSLININTATLEELDRLPNIGPVIAQRIIDYRTEYGDFQSVYDLLDVTGIGEKTLEKILDLITI